MLTSSLLALLIVHQLGLMSPGPDFAVVVKNSLLSSRKAGLFTALGIVSGLAIHLMYTFAGLALVISQSIVLFSIIKYAGAVYLIWIGWKGLRAKRGKSVGAGLTSAQRYMQEAPAWKVFRQGFLTNALNPKVTLFFFSVFPQFITPDTAIGTKVFYATVLLVQNFAWFSLVATVFSTSALRSRLSGIRHWLDRIFGVVLIALGVKVVLSNK